MNLKAHGPRGFVSQRCYHWNRLRDILLRLAIFNCSTFSAALICARDENGQRGCFRAAAPQLNPLRRKSPVSQTASGASNPPHSDEIPLRAVSPFDDRLTLRGPAAPPPSDTFVFQLGTSHRHQPLIGRPQPVQQPGRI